MMRSDIGAHKFDKDKWGSELAPILNLWKKLNQVSINGLRKKKQKKVF